MYVYLCSLQVFVVVVVVNWLSSFSLIFRIYDLAYSPDGNQLLAAAGSNILVCPLCPPSFIFFIYYNYYIYRFAMEKQESWRNLCVVTKIMCTVCVITEKVV